MKRILWWELAGFVVISLAGSALHFAFEWSGYLRAVALIAAVNESVWEHLKLAFWPALIFAAVEYSFLHAHIKNFWVAKSMALWIMPVTISVLFYAHAAVLGHSWLPLDLTIFFLAVGLGQWVSYRVITSPPVGSRARQIANLGLLPLMTAFCLFTYWPPYLFLFADPRSGRFGIPAL